MQLRVLGTSAAMSSASRGHVAFVLWASRPLLIECGPTVPWQLERIGIDHRAISDIFVSHLHGDHSLGIPMFLTVGQLDGRPWPLRIHCPASAVDRLKALATICYPGLAALVEQQVEWIGLDAFGGAGLNVADGTRLSWAPGVHGVPDLAYRFDFEGRSLVYSGDTAPAEAVRRLASGANLLLHDATWSELIDGTTTDDHSSCRQAGHLAKEAGAQRLGLVHLHKRYAGREADLVREAAEVFQGEVIVPGDGDELGV
jgi:ribonuclease Z